MFPRGTNPERAAIYDVASKRTSTFNKNKSKPNAPPERAQHTAQLLHTELELTEVQLE
jgi:hypothetical protein